MYSGNHSLCHPLDTVLRAAEAMRDDDSTIFLFVGGGHRVGDVVAMKEQKSLGNVLCLPYEPRAGLSDSLSAADLHVVVMGEAFVGIVHPSKFYGVLAVERPTLFVGPKKSFVAETIAAHGVGTRVDHNDVAGAVAAIEAFRALSAEELQDIVVRTRNAASRFEKRRTIANIVGVIGPSLVGRESEGP